jgi:hypothetical protein
MAIVIDIRNNTLAAGQLAEGTGISIAPTTVTPLVGPTLSITPGVAAIPRPPPPIPFNQPPAPVDNLIVESPIQRADNSKPFSRGALVRSLPEEANPYRTLPQEILDSMGDPNLIAEYYKLERPLDLLRQKGDKFWNKFEFSGFYMDQQEETENLPFWIEYVPPENFFLGSIVDVFQNTNLRPQFPNTNFMGVYKKEFLVLNANPTAFQVQQGTIDPNAPLGGRVTRPTTSITETTAIPRNVGGSGIGGGGDFGGGGYP